MLHKKYLEREMTCFRRYIQRSTGFCDCYTYVPNKLKSDFFRLGIFSVNSN